MKLFFRSAAIHWRRRFGPFLVWVDGVKIDLRHISSSSVRLHLLKGHYQREERLLLDFAIADGDRVVELGVGIGLLGLIAARRAGVSGEVLACSFDMASKNIALKNYSINKLSPKLVPVLVDKDVENHFSSTSIGSRNKKSEKADCSDIDNAALLSELSKIVSQYSPNVLVADLRGYENDFFRFDPMKEVQKVLVKMYPRILGLKPCQDLEVVMVEKGFYVCGRMGDSVLFSRREKNSTT